MFRGTRVPIQALFDYLEGGGTLEDFLAGFPTVTREALEEAKELLLARRVRGLPRARLVEITIDAEAILEEA